MFNDQSVLHAFPDKETIESYLQEAIDRVKSEPRHELLMHAQQQLLHHEKFIEAANTCVAADYMLLAQAIRFHYG